MARISYELLLSVAFSLLWASGYSMPTHSGEGCAYENNLATCRYEVFCNNRVDISLYRQFEHHRYCPFVSYKGNNFDHIYLVIKEYHKNEAGNENLILSDMEGSANIVYSLDFSDDQLDFTPTLTTMINLNILNFSRNSLTEAKLCNAYDLEALREIDLSYNTINTITIYDNQYAYKKLEKINLSHNYLVSIEEAIFDSFTELESLDLSYNFIDTLSILSFEGIKNLKYLNLEHNRLSEMGSSLLRFYKLTELNMSENKISNIKFDDFGKLRSLHILDLSSNLIQNIEANAFRNMVELESLNLNTNLLEDIDKDAFTNLTNLNNIDLSKNHIKALPRDVFKDKQIQEFSIKDNKLEGSLTKGIFAGLQLILELDLSHQQLTDIEDFAFYGLDKLSTLFLNNNQLQTLSKKSFSTLRSLEILDLSNNELTNIEFDKSDLISLQSLLLKNNKLIEITQEYFSGISTLQFLDLSSNNISRLEINSFKSLRDLINIQLSNNPINGTLEENTFDGLNSLPTLDISNTLLTTIKNGSFNSMSQLKDLNISHCKITELQYNTFSHTGLIETLDLSFNQLTDFYVNTTGLMNLVNLLLNNNLLTTVSSSFFSGLPRLIKIIISKNNIENIDDAAFLDQKDIRYLDLSYNPNLKFNVSKLENAPNLVSLLLSAIRTNITFALVKETRISNLEMSYSEICNITALELKSLKHLDDLILSHNNITRVEAGALNGVKHLRKLDLSFNQINYIQPGAFKDNTVLISLNISHNFLTVVNYGIFNGLMYLDTIDLSYNEISDLESERFYEVRSLSVLIVDHNKIRSLNADEFAGTSLTKLSIGDNPIPCDLLVNFKKTSIPFAITAMKLEENGFENVDGVTCNMKHSLSKTKQNYEGILGNQHILLDIKDILYNLSLYKNHEITVGSAATNDSKYLLNITSQIEQGNANTSLLLQNISSTFAKGNTNTNMLLDKIFKVLTAINTIRKPSTIPVPKGNVTADSLVPYINKIKQELEDTIAFEKQNILSEVDTKISQLSSSHLLTNEAYSSTENSDSKSFLFIEVCVGLILVLLVVFILYKFYNSGMFVPSLRSTSTRHLSDDMENSAL